MKDFIMYSFSVSGLSWVRRFVFFRSFWHIPSSTGIIISLPCNLHFYISAAVLIFGGATAELYHPSSGASCILPTLQNETNFHSLEDYGLMCGGNTKKFKTYVKSEKWNSENLVFFLLRRCKGWCI